VILENYKIIKSLHDVLNQLRSDGAETSGEKAGAWSEKALNEGMGVGTLGVKDE
jgi:hypothetical protein